MVWRLVRLIGSARSMTNREEHGQACDQVAGAMAENAPYAWLIEPNKQFC